MTFLTQRGLFGCTKAPQNAVCAKLFNNNKQRKRRDKFLAVVYLVGFKLRYLSLHQFQEPQLKTTRHNKHLFSDRKRNSYILSPFVDLYNFALAEFRM